VAHVSSCTASRCARMFIERWTSIRDDDIDTRRAEPARAVFASNQDKRVRSPKWSDSTRSVSEGVTVSTLPSAQVMPRG